MHISKNLLQRGYLKVINLENIDIFHSMLVKVRQIRNDFFKPKFLPKNEWSNSFLLLVDLVSFVFWKKVKTPKRQLEINPLKTNNFWNPVRAFWGHCWKFSMCLSEGINWIISKISQRIWKNLSGRKIINHSFRFQSCEITVCREWSSGRRGLEKNYPLFDIITYRTLLTSMTLIVGKQN